MAFSPLWSHPCCLFCLPGHWSCWFRAPPLWPHLTSVASLKMLSSSSHNGGWSFNVGIWGELNSVHSMWLPLMSIGGLEVVNSLWKLCVCVYGFLLGRKFTLFLGISKNANRTHDFSSTSLIIFLVGMLYADPSQRLCGSVSPVVSFFLDFEILLFGCESLTLSNG